MPRKRKNTSAQEARPAPSTQSPGSPGPDSVANPPVSYLSGDGTPSSIASSITILDNADVTILKVVAIFLMLIV